MKYKKVINSELVRSVSELNYDVTIAKELMMGLIKPDSSKDILTSEIYLELKNSYIEASRKFEAAKSKLIRDVQNEVEATITSWNLDYNTCELIYETTGTEAGVI